MPHANVGEKGWMKKYAEDQGYGSDESITVDSGPDYVANKQSGIGAPKPRAASRSRFQPKSRPKAPGPRLPAPKPKAPAPKPKAPAPKPKGKKGK